MVAFSVFCLFVKEAFWLDRRIFRLYFRYAAIVSVEFVGIVTYQKQFEILLNPVATFCFTIAFLL